MTIEAFQTISTCAAHCWYAREDTCRCFCGGANHGILLSDGAEQPVRMMTKKGKAYELALVTEDYVEASKAASAIDTANGCNNWSEPGWHKRTRCEVKSAAGQKWPELEPFKDARRRPYLVWAPRS